MKDGLALYKKFKLLINSNPNDEAVFKFLSNLSYDEYNMLIEIFTKNDFPNIGGETKKKILIVLNNLKDKLFADKA